MRAAAARRDAAWGRAVTYSPKVFLPLTNLCRNRCDYCDFRRSPGDEGAWTMSRAQLAGWLDRARAAGCVEALFCIGDTPEAAFPGYRRQLEGWGLSSTVDYLIEGAEMALARGLIPHTNAGILSAGDMARLRPVNASLGLMLESVSERLCQPGGAHHRAPDKRPARRLRMTEEAGALKIPFTSGVLLGIGETRRERIETLEAIAGLHARHGHIQEVIVQNFRAAAGTPMADRPEPGPREVAWTIAAARLILPAEVTVQAPPNLNPAHQALLLAAGINDFGGISPVSPDYINRGHPWPHLERLAAICAAEGYRLAPRLPIYPAWSRPAWVDPAMRAPLAAAAARLDQEVARAS